MFITTLTYQSLTSVFHYLPKAYSEEEGTEMRKLFFKQFNAVFTFLTRVCIGRNINLIEHDQHGRRGWGKGGGKSVVLGIV